MAWCEDCDRYVTPTSAAADGTCPFCESSTVLVERAASGGGAPAVKAPWHFKLIVVLTAGYLLWRLVEFVRWLI